jgi:streptogramin lyase
VTEFGGLTAGSGPVYITAGPDGNLWFTEINGNRIGRITTTGVVTEFVLPHPDSGPEGIAVGPDGALWFTEADVSRIGRITTGGAITEFPTPAEFAMTQIVTGSDGNLWYASESARIGRVTPAGAVTEFPTPPGQPTGIAAGPDGNLWFTDLTGTNAIGRVEIGACQCNNPLSLKCFKLKKKNKCP